ncbi:ABC-type nitrate/sulfonate/bicarbonate transport system, permease component [Microbacterium testaceum StLB037]|uniref:ABC-type nitrate/sulfonate/bicarbonate transport system, permease component n=1 Tax=Microbacterium testaceum (strain StLB037) TaxID=979556 RepID=E8NA56_MICTS|nr:ABC transporter permease subunit [Microbacterium testaceum]BAJ75886.1 ABC-type nitrate/sulfonate/bicarbonate transport system, permease component [Microbacterium testaceum StLB037]
MTDQVLTPGATEVVGRAPSRRGRAATARIGWGVAGVAAVIVLWELYKFLGPADGVTVGGDGSAGSGVILLPRTHDRAMPHVWDMIARMSAPTSGGDTPPLILSVAQAAGTTLGLAALGWLIGVVVGSLLGIAMQRWRLVEAGLLPWIVVSQIVPLIAFAPVVNALGTQIDRSGFPWPQWFSVALIASYLAFFPVAVGMLRGLDAPDALHLDLMRSSSAGWWQTLVHLRLPAAVPHLLPALRLAAASAVVGAVVAEVSIGLRGGIGRMLIQLAGQASSDPAAPWAPTFGTVVMGLVAAGGVALVGVALHRFRRGEDTA